MPLPFVRARGVLPEGHQLAALVDQGVLITRVAGTYPLDEVAKAHVHFAEGGVRGRLVFVP
ncbi:zinc-binding dehydrogenase [Streptosporangium lutulentum]|uniref:zinc-binding dehydrogenase n=1 Tax=Streptosporangium lutulentum TaxID=1461250 RepID=UPI00352180E7